MLRFVTYNIRACLGVDGRRSVDRIAEVISELDPDVVALQEVDRGRQRSQAMDQAGEIARRTSMHPIFCPSFMDPRGGEYGNAVLTKAPARLIRHLPLPCVEGNEPRSAMCVRFDLENVTLDVINTHLGFRRVDRRRQLEELAGPTWSSHPEGSTNLIVCGDLNCSPREPGFRLLTEQFSDAQRETPGRALATWPTRWPIRRLDYILISPNLRATRAVLHRTAATRMASDHYPLVLDAELLKNEDQGSVA